VTLLRNGRRSALFGKRSEVSDARDRYANVEVAYLLQRLETFEGLVVMTTNLQNNIDQAFLRRVHVTVEFPLPDPADRKKIWTLFCLSTALQNAAITIPQLLCQRAALHGDSLALREKALGLRPAISASVPSLKGSVRWQLI